MASVNKVILIGNLGAAPELRTTGSGQSVCELRLATNERWKDAQGESQERTEWHRVVVWGRQGENCARYLDKGRSAYVEGRIQTREWEDKDGQRRFTTEIVAQLVQFIGGAGERDDRPAPTQRSSQDAHARANPTPPAPSGFDDDEIPF